MLKQEQQQQLSQQKLLESDFDNFRHDLKSVNQNDSEEVNSISFYVNRIFC